MYKHTVVLKNRYDNLYITSCISEFIFLPITLVLDSIVSLFDKLQAITNTDNMAIYHQRLWNL